jgi:hypothetical protein
VAAYPLRSGPGQQDGQVKRGPSNSKPDASLLSDVRLARSSVSSARRRPI